MLATLPRLAELCFSDPLWGDCPLAQLCNYQTFVLFMLPRCAGAQGLGAGGRRPGAGQAGAGQAGP